MSLSLRPRWVYTDALGAVDYHARLPQRPWDPGTDTLGGSDVSAAGVPAAFLIRRDPLWHVTLRFPEGEWPNVERLIAHGQGAGSITFYPDRLSGLSHTVYLLSPAMGERVRPRRSDEPSTQEIDLVLRRTTTGAGTAVADLYYDEALLSFSAGDDLRSAVFARAGAVGPYIDADGVLQNALANVPRIDHVWWRGVWMPTLVIEDDHINLNDTDDFSAWDDNSGTPTHVAVADTDLTGYTIADDDGAAVEQLGNVVTFTGDGVKGFSWVVRENTMPASGVQRLGFEATTGSPGVRGELQISAWVDGEPTVAAANGAAYLGKRYVGNGRWQLFGLTAAITASETTRAFIIPASVAADTGSLDVFRLNVYNSTRPPSSILNASQTLGNESFYQSFLHDPQAMSGLVDFFEGEVTPFVLEFIQLLGDATESFISVYREPATDLYRVQHHTPAGDVYSQVDINPARGNRVRIRWDVDATGAVLIAASKDEGSGFSAETVGARSAANTFASRWGAAPRRSLGQQANYIATAILPGSGRTLADLVRYTEAA
jgi:hypothetical protein